MGVETIPDPCGGGCCEPGCSGCQCAVFIVPANIKITVALSFELVDFSTFPFTTTTTTYSTVFSPIATDPTFGCLTGVSSMPGTLSYHNGGTYNMDTSLFIASPGLKLCNIDIPSFNRIPLSFDYAVRYDFRSASFTDHFHGNDVATVSTSCNPDGTWVITFTGSQIWDHSSGYNFNVYPTMTFTVEPIP